MDSVTNKRKSCPKTESATSDSVVVEGLNLTEI